MNTIWRKPQTNAAKQCGVKTAAVIQRTATGYVWRLMIQDQQLASGRAGTQLECREAVRAFRATMAGEPPPRPYARRLKGRG